MKTLPPDEHLRTALRHAPDAQLAAPPELSAQILAAAHRSAEARPPVKVNRPKGWGPVLLAWWRQPAAASALASLLLAGFIGLLWRGETPGPVSDRTAREGVAQAPLAAAPTPAFTAAQTARPASQPVVKTPVTEGRKEAVGLRRLSAERDSAAAVTSSSVATAPAVAPSPSPSPSPAPAPVPVPVPVPVLAPLPAQATVEARRAADLTNNASLRAERQVAAPPTAPAPAPVVATAPAATAAAAAAAASNATATPAAAAAVQAERDNAQRLRAMPAPAAAPRSATPAAGPTVLSAAPSASPLADPPALQAARQTGQQADLSPLEGWTAPAGSAYPHPDANWMAALLLGTKGQWVATVDAKPAADALALEQWSASGLHKQLWLEARSVLWCSGAGPCLRAPLSVQQRQALLQALVR